MNFSSAMQDVIIPNISSSMLNVQYCGNKVIMPHRDYRTQRGKSVRSLKTKPDNKNKFSNNIFIRS